LQADDNYSIIKSCFPYVAKRLVGDQDPRARKALRDLLYGASDAIDADRLADLADGFTSYTTTTKTINQQAKSTKPGEIVLADGTSTEKISKSKQRKERMIEAESTITLAKDSADILLAPEGNLLQDLLVEEGALAASARFKDTVRELAIEGPRKLRETLPFGDFLPPLPFESRLEPFIQKTHEETKAQQLAQRLLSIVPDSAAPVSGVVVVGADENTAATVLRTLRGLDPEQAALVVKEIRQNAPRYARLIGQLGGKFASKLLYTASSNIESALEDWDSKHPDRLTETAAKSLASLAQRGAYTIEQRQRGDDVDDGDKYQGDAFVRRR